MYNGFFSCQLRVLENVGTYSSHGDFIISGSNLLGALDLYTETPDGKEV